MPRKPRPKENDPAASIDNRQKAPPGNSRATAVAQAVLLLGGALAVVVVLLVGAINQTQPAHDSTQPPPPRTTSRIAAAVSVVETFDDLPMNSHLSDPWAISGTGSAEITALPTSVDRSLRISSSGTGAPTTACRRAAEGSGTVFRISFDYLLGRSPASAVPLLRLESLQAQRLELDVDVAGRPFAVGPPGATAAVQGTQETPTALTSSQPIAAAWVHVEVVIDVVSGAAQWSAHDSSGAETSSGTTALSGALGEHIERACLLSPAGAPAAWVAIDNLLIEA
jgi:hypothetical protein